MAFVAGTVLTAAALNTEFAAKTDTAMVQNAQTGTSYSYALTDASKLLSMSNAASNTVLVTKQATVTWVTGTQLRIMNLGAGVTTLVADTGVTINNNQALAQYQGGTLIRTASDVWTFQPNGQKIGQVVSAIKSDTFTTTSTSYTDLTGMSVTITPSSASALVLVMAKIEGASTAGTSNSVGAYQLMRAATAIAIGDTAASRVRATGIIGTRLEGITNTRSNTIIFLDSPAIASAVTYKIQVRVGAGTLYINRTEEDSDPSSYRVVSTITVMEVSP